jgi:transposase
LAPGQAADVKVAEYAEWPQLSNTTTVADKGHDSNDFRALLRQCGSRPCIPSRSLRKESVTWHRGYYRCRHRIENFFQRAKRFRRVGTRYDKSHLYFLAFVHLAAILDWLIH